MKAVILAAGKSTRTYPLTLDRPKPLLLLANRPLLAWNLDQLVGLVDEVILVVGYKKEMIQEAFGQQYRGLRLRYVVQEEQLGTGQALQTVEPFVGDRFLVMNGDDLYSVLDIQKVMKYSQALLVKEVVDYSKFGMVLVENGLVKGIVEKPDHFVSRLANLGLYQLSSSIFPLLKLVKKSSRGEYEITDALSLLAQQSTVRYAVLQDYWLPIGYLSQVLEADRFLRQRYVRTPVILGENVSVGSSSVLKDCSVGDQCQIGEQVQISDSLLYPTVVVGKGSIIEHAIIGEGVVIPPQTVIRNECLVAVGKEMIRKDIVS